MSSNNGRNDPTFHRPGRGIQRWVLNATPAESDSVLSKGKSMASQSPMSSMPIAGSSVPKILVVDDRPDNLLALEAALLETGAQVIKAESGTDALRHLLEEDFSVILLDVKMPDMDGFETAGLIRQRERSRNTPIIFLTAFRNEEALFRGYHLGAVDYLFKPVVPEVLRSKVSVFIEFTRQKELLRRNAEVLEDKNRELRQTMLERERAEEELRRANLNLSALNLQLAEKAERIEQQAKELVRSNEELERFASIASHDLQEPLRTVASYTQFLAERYQSRLDPEADEFIRFVVDGVNRMRALIEDLLSYSKVGARRRPWERFGSRQALELALSNLSGTIEERDAELQIEELPEILGDPGQISQVFQNLLGNALKFCKKAKPRIRVAAEPQGHTYRFSVKDNGIGIESKYADRIFQVFQRLHTRAEYPGTGIGLAICKKIVEHHGGQIWFESAPGKGTTFFFTLPAAEVAIQNGDTGPRNATVADSVG